MPLTEKRIKATLPETKTVRLPDGLGLVLEVRASGAKTFVKTYRFAGQQRRETIGIYPGITLAEARERTLEINKTVKCGEDPRKDRPGVRAVVARAAAEVVVAPELQFEAVCDLLIEKRVKEGIAPATESKLRRHLGDAAEKFHGRDIRHIEPPEILEYIEHIQDSGRYETARDTRRKMSQVFQLAAARGLSRNDPAHIIRGALVSKPPTPHPGVTDAKDVGILMRQIHGYHGDAPTQAALRLSVYTALRSRELRGAQWKEIDFDSATWTIPADRMKKKYGEHLVPLSTQSVETLRWLERETGGDPERLVFRSTMYRDRPISENTVNAALRRMGYDTRKEHCHHGFRTTFSTNMNEQGWNRDWIEKQLAHYEKNEVRLAYNRAMYLDGRRKMMQAYADWLDKVEGF
jgi:integrase